MTISMFEIAATGTDALAAIAEQPFDCVVLDLRLPDMSGFDVLERLRDTPSLNDLPVVVFTGKDLSPDEDARLRMLGAQRRSQRCRVAGTAAR